MLVVSLVFMVTMLMFGLPFILMVLFGVALFIKLIIMFSTASLRKNYLLLCATDTR